MKINISNDYKELSKAVAAFTAGYIKANPGKLLCFAAGETPLGMFKELIEIQNSGEIDLNTMWYIGLDEWVGLGYEDKGSCRQVMMDSLYKAARIREDRILIFDGKDSNIGKQCSKAENWITSKNGIGLTVLGVGMNGHVGFNEPGGSIEERCLLVELDEVTKSVGRKYFDGEICPTKGITVGIGLLQKAGCVVLMANDEKKAGIIKAALEGEKTNHNPASLMQNHNNVICFLDTGAASMLKNS